MADETPKVTEPAAAQEQVKAAPAPAAPAAAPVPPARPAPAPAPKPEPAHAGPELMAVKMANATNGARYPGQVLEVDAEQGRLLIQAGEAYPA